MLLIYDFVQMCLIIGSKESICCYSSQLGLKQVYTYLIRTNFGAEKIWRNWRNLPEIAKLNPHQI